MLTIREILAVRHERLITKREAREWYTEAKASQQFSKPGASASGFFCIFHLADSLQDNQNRKNLSTTYCDPERAGELVRIVNQVLSRVFIKTRDYSTSLSLQIENHKLR